MGFGFGWGGGGSDFSVFSATAAFPVSWLGTVETLLSGFGGGLLGLGWGGGASGSGGSEGSSSAGPSSSAGASSACSIWSCRRRSFCKSSLSTELVGASGGGLVTFFRGRSFSTSGLGDLSLLKRLLPVR